MKKEKLYKKCPRCGEKTFAQATYCDNCKLIFSRLQFASNKLAKKCIARGEKEKVIKSPDLPKDLNKWKLLAMCVFGGWFGLHNIYIGRYIKGFFSLGLILLTSILVLVMEGELLANIYNTFLFIPAAFVMYFWFADMFQIGFDRYRVPIALDIPDKKVEETPEVITVEDKENIK